MIRLMSIITFAILLISPVFGQSYLEIPPVKLLTVGSIANRCPAAGSVENGGYRTSIENGFVCINQLLILRILCIWKKKEKSRKSI